MKKALLWLLLLTIPFTFGCPSPRNDNVGNTNTGNTNAGNTNADANSITVVLQTKRIRLSRLLFTKGGKYKRSLSPQSNPFIYQGKNHQLRFSAFNRLDVDISKIEVTIEYRGSNEAPVRRW